jgi:hypothetical protein
MKLPIARASLFAFALLATSTLAVSAQAATSAKAGGLCSPVGAKTTIAGKSYSCVKALSGKLVWAAAPSFAGGSASSGTNGTKPSIAGGVGGGPDDEGSPADLARHAAMKKFSDCLVAHGGTAMTLGGPGAPGGPGGPGRDGGPDDHHGQPGQPGANGFGPNEPAAALTACASLAPKFGGPGH